VQLQRRRNLRQTKRSGTLCEQIQYRKSPVQGLNLISALRSCVSQYGPPFFLSGLINSLRSMKRHVNCWYAISVYETPAISF
jgi:hypothetical protein